MRQDLVAEQIWGVLVAAAQEGVTDPNVIAHAAARNVLTALDARPRPTPRGGTGEGTAGDDGGEGTA